MRVRPNPLAAIGVFGGYLAIVAAIWKINGVDYATVGNTTANVVAGIIGPIGVGALYLAVVTTALGWWRPAMSEGSRTGPKWLLSVPILLALAILLNLLTVRYSALSASLLLMLFVGTALVGFSEELLTRGLLLVGFRSRLSEVWVWLFSTLLFGILHAINALFGQSLGQTVFQIVIAFLAGTALYVTRMVTGGLIIPMVLHALWDFGTLSMTASGVPGSIGTLPAFLAYLVALVGVAFAIRARNRATVAAEAPETVAEPQTPAAG